MTLPVGLFAALLFAVCMFAAQVADPTAGAIAQCGACHAREAASIGASPMTHSIQAAANSTILKNEPDLAFSAGKFRYSVRREKDATIYSVTDGINTVSAPIAWAFGTGITGQTWLVEREGALYEGAVSYYSGIKGLDITPGHAALPRRTLEEAFGRKVDAAEARRCFGCHSTDVVWNGGLYPDSLTPGVQCWQCHQGSLEHANALRAGNAVPAARMVSLRTVSNEGLAAVCNDCHPGWAEIASKGPKGVVNVRMQFYRLANSRCYDSEDRRISCTACHDVHGNLSTDLASYDSPCQACHAPGNQAAKSCPVAARDCISCHMPKVEIPGMHYQFTDHEIRIARKGDAYPD
jgi:hypothetical protein